MTKLYEKNETAFAVMWILIYIFGTCLAEALSEMAGIYKLFPAIFHAGLAAFILVWVKERTDREIRAFPSTVSALPSLVFSAAGIDCKL